MRQMHITSSNRSKFIIVA